MEAELPRTYQLSLRSTLANYFAARLTKQHTAQQQTAQQSGNYQKLQDFNTSSCRI